jgi:hypothetical protein
MKNVSYPDTISIALDETNNKVISIYSDHSIYVWDVKDIRRVKFKKMLWEYINNLVPRLENHIPFYIIPPAFGVLRCTQTTSIPLTWQCLPAVSSRAPATTASDSGMLMPKISQATQHSEIFIVM